MATAESIDVRDLDALELEPKSAGRSRWRTAFATSAPPLVALGILLAVWALVSRADIRVGLVPAVPSPGDVFAAVRDFWSRGDLQSAAWGSVHRAVLGFLASVLIATPIGVLVGRVAVLRRAVQPLLSAFQSLPSVAWVPAALLWFGPTSSMIYFVVLAGAIPSIANGTIAGLDQVPPLFTRVGRVLGAHGVTMARFVLLPAALPSYLSGLKQGWAFSWRSLMAAEIIVQSTKLGNGLGLLLKQGSDLSDTAQIMAAILLILTVGIVIELGVFAPVERRILRNRGLRPA
ncbi:MAG: sulfonate transport system permease protein [Frankiaceae bacterium]|jgi:NitT/TauT family transport system permease protein|nr:sulfonate transport system permease protein [Frankiaceae bacterium]